MNNKISPNDITLANMNVWFGLDCRGIFKFGEYETSRIRAARFQNLANGFKNQQPDVIGIQEVNPLPGYVKKLSGTLGYDAVWKVTNSGIKLMGDFNSTVDSPEMKQLFSRLDLLDSYAIKNPDKLGYTWDPARNPNTGYDASSFWANGITARHPLSKIKAEFDRDMARRIDFIFLSYQFEPDMIKKVDSIFTQPTNGLFTSDHFGVQVVLKRLP